MWRLPQELQGLGDKTAATLATCFERLVSTWLDKLISSQPQAAAAPGRRGISGQPQAAVAAPVAIWLVHCMIGDGIATNEATAKIVCALFRDLRVCEWGQVGCVSAPRWYQHHHHISIFTTWARVGASGLLRGAPPRSGAIMLGQRLQC